MGPDSDHEGYTPEMARRLEEREDQLDDLIDIAIYLSPQLWPYLAGDVDSLRRIIEDAARQYRAHRERTPGPELMTVPHFVEHFVERVEAERADLGTSPATVWTEYAARLEVKHRVVGVNPSGVSRRLRCFDQCCLDDPHAEMRLLLHGREIGGTRFERERQWVSWGPAGESAHHATRSDAEVVQIDAWLRRPVRVKEPEGHDDP